MNNEDGEIVKGKFAYWIVTSVKAKSDYTLEITFIDGKRKIYNALPLLDIPIYEPLKNIAFFLKATVAGGTVVWNDDIDLAPEHLYACSKEI